MVQSLQLLYCSKGTQGFEPGFLVGVEIYVLLNKSGNNYFSNDDSQLIPVLTPNNTANTLNQSPIHVLPMLHLMGIDHIVHIRVFYPLGVVVQTYANLKKKHENLIILS